MAYVFSDTLICDDADAAKKVTFNNQVGVRSVTFDGDVYDPSGTLSGGSAPNGSGILIQVQELLDIEAKLKEAQKILSNLQQEEAKGRQARDQWRKLTRELEIKEHELKLLEDQVEGSNASRVGGYQYPRETTNWGSITLDSFTGGRCQEINSGPGTCCSQCTS